MSGGGTNYRKKASCKAWLRKIRLFFKKLAEAALKSRAFFNQLAKSLNKKQYFGLRVPNHGGILIEFAFSVPVLIILLYFVNDHYVFNMYKNKIKTSAYLAASMVQQVSNNRTNKALTKNDLSRISWCCFYNLFPNRDIMTNYDKTGMIPKMYYIYVKRVSNNNYTYQWIYWASETTTLRVGTVTNANISTIQKISQDLVCENDGDERLLLLPFYHLINGYYNKFKIGLYLLPLKGIGGLDTTAGYGPSEKRMSQIKLNFNYSLVITPKPGLFPIQ